MNVAVVAPLPPIRSGIARHSANVVEALRAEGHAVDCYSWSKQYPNSIYRRPEFDPRLDASGAVDRSLHWAKPWSWSAIGRRAARTAELLCIPWVTPFNAVATATIIHQASLPAVAVVHNARPHEHFPGTPWLTRLGLSRVTGVVAHSTSVVSDLRSYGVTAPASVVPHPPNIAMSPTEPPSGPPTKLLFLGFIRHYKGLDLLTRALAILPEDFTLTVAGEPWDSTYREVSVLIEELGLEDRVTRHARYMSEDEISALLESHHLVVAPYRTATQSGIVPLAFAAGRPVVATAVSGIEEAITDRHNGVLCEPRAESLAAAITEAAATYETLVEGASRTRWSWSDVAREIVAMGSES